MKEEGEVEAEEIEGKKNDQKLWIMKILKREEILEKSVICGDRTSSAR